MKQRIIGIKSLYDTADERLKAKAVVPCSYVAKDGTIGKTDVVLTEAEKRTIEALAMRLFIEHKKVVKKSKTDDGRVQLSAFLIVGKQEKE